MKKYAICLLIWLGLMASDELFAADDPTRPESITEVQGESTWDLTAIFVSNQRRFAVMQGVIVSMGSKVDNAEIVDIQPEYVLLKNGNEVYKVPLVGTSVKQSRK